MVDLDFDALRAGEAPESYLCDLGNLVVQTVRLCEFLYSTKDHNGAATTMNHRIGVSV
jgi:hypothetical protein